MLPIKYIFSICLLSCFSWATARDLPTFAQVKNNTASSEAILLDRHGQVLQSLRLKSNGRRLAWIPLAQISPAVVQAVLTSEDQRFYQHDGVDWQAFGGAVWDSLTGDQRGASTLSMQLVGLLDEDLRARNKGRSVWQKMNQIQAAGELEKSWQKEAILEAYLNLASFRGEAQGIGSISQYLFNKQAAGLNQREAILLASLLRSPNAPSRVIANRACSLAQLLNTAPDCENLRSFVMQTLQSAKYYSTTANAAPEAAHLLLKTPNSRVASSLDADLQKQVRHILQQQLAELNNRNVHDAAAVVLDNRTGEILAYVGNIGSLASSQFVDGIAAPRQAGSTLKPFLYAQAIESTLITAASLLEDSPLNLPTSSGLYVPQNYDKNFKGIVTARTALASSLNIPAVRTLMLVGEEVFFERLQQLGFNLPESGAFYGYAMALGAADVSLLDLTNAYRSLANAGEYSPVVWRVAEASKKQRVFSAQASFIIADILADREARSLTFGLENPLGTRYWSAVKTGTSKDMRDNWCIGFAERYTVGVWVGNFSGEPMWDVSGVSGAAPAWLAIMNVLHHQQTSRPPSPPAGVQQVFTRFPSQIAVPHSEWFIAGTEQSVIELINRQNSAMQIIYPSENTKIALDPDIPSTRQRVLFQAQAGEGLADWWLNGKKWGNVASAPLWQPQAGRYVLELRLAGRVLDSVHFQVRGGKSQ